MTRDGPGPLFRALARSAVPSASTSPSAPPPDGAAPDRAATPSPRPVAARSPRLTISRIVTGGYVPFADLRPGPVVRLRDLPHYEIEAWRRVCALHGVTDADISSMSITADAVADLGCWSITIDADIRPEAQR